MPQKKCTKNIRSFAINLYDYVWTKHSFTSRTLQKHLTANLCLQIERTRESRSSHFNERIGKAVLCSQYLLRQFCLDFFTCMGKSMVYSRYFFKFFIYFILYKWTHHRSDVFTKVLDSCAIIAEAVLFLETKTEICGEIKLAPELFSEFFECNLATEFFEKGGWDKLAKRAADEYSYLYLILEEFIDSINPPYAVPVFGDDLVDALRDSPVMFPVSYSEFRENNIQMIVGEKLCYVTYDRTLAEIFEQSYSNKLPTLLSTEKLNKNCSVESINETNRTTETNFSYVLIGGEIENLIESWNLTDGKLSSKSRRKRKSKKLLAKGE